MCFIDVLLILIVIEIVIVIFYMTELHVVCIWKTENKKNPGWIAATRINEEMLHF